MDLLLTDIPDKIVNVQGFEDILGTDHKHTSFQIDLQIKKLPKVKRTIYNLRNANWMGLNEMLTRAPWDLCFVISDVEQSLSNWYDMFMSIVNDNVPKLTINNANVPHGWIQSCDNY